MHNTTVRARVIKSDMGSFKMITKADNYTGREEDPTLAGLDGVISPPYPVKELKNMIEMSTILQQCVEAYRRNIVGFGASMQYIKDETQLDETPEMKAEWDKVDEWKKYFNFDKSFEDVWGQAIEDREITGNGYIEILRDTTGLPVGGENLLPEYMQVCRLGDLVDVKYNINGKQFTRKRRFRKYIQEIGTIKTYFKEFGDPRKMDSTTGLYSEAVTPDKEANELIHLKIGTGAYGIPRWIGQLIHMYGARKAEELNYRYFIQGRHTPMAIMLSNAQLSPDSEAALVDYAKSVEGVENSHKFLIIETEAVGDELLDEKKPQVKVELKSLAEMLQQDALFLEYDDASRQKVQSAFRLPDIYVGRSKDFNRATADTARTITEEQVFEPERNSIEFIINNKLLIDMVLVHVKVQFNKPEISDTAELAQILTVLNAAGGIAPNDVRDLAGKVLGKDLEAFEGDEYNIPKGFQTAEQKIKADEQHQAQIASLQQRIQKSESGMADMLSIMKDVRDVLEELEGRVGDAKG